MPQIRIHNYGASAVSSYENIALWTTNHKGVYRGMDLGVDIDGNLTIGIGYAVMFSPISSVDMAIAWHESTLITLPFLPPGPPTNYTVVARHANRQIFGGVAVEYEYYVGVDADIADGIVLGWIYHPGGGAALTLDMLLSAPKYLPSVYSELVQQSSPVVVRPPFDETFFTAQDPEITLTPKVWDGANFVIHQELENSPTAIGPKGAEQQFMFFMGAYRPSSVEVYMYYDSNPATSLEIEIYDTDRVLVPPVTGPIVGGSVDWVDASVDISRTLGTFDTKKPFTVRVTHTLPVAGVGRLAKLVVNFWPYPG